MESRIHTTLKEIEAEHNIKVLFACESGSRAWGFPSPDSDYDVRFIYAHPVNKYLSVQKRKEELNFPITDELDLNGWDISKLLQLIGKSNSTPVEWLQSPIIYHNNDDLRMELMQLCQYYFCARTNVHHYTGMAKAAMGTMERNTIHIKKLFYVLRPLLAALWCVDKETIAPMNITPLMQLLPVHIKDNVTSLIELKKTAEERFEIQVNELLINWITETYAYCMEKSKLLERKKTDPDALDECFRKVIF